MIACYILTFIPEHYCIWAKYRYEIEESYQLPNSKKQTTGETGWSGWPLHFRQIFKWLSDNRPLLFQNSYMLSKIRRYWRGQCLNDLHNHNFRLFVFNMETQISKQQPNTWNMLWLNYLDQNFPRPTQINNASRNKNSISYETNFYAAFLWRMC